MTFKVGDKVQVVTSIDAPLFHKGDIGVIQTVSSVILVDFNNQGNPHVYGDGQWFTLDTDLELANAQPS